MYSRIGAAQQLSCSGIDAVKDAPTCCLPIGFHQAVGFVLSPALVAGMALVPFADIFNHKASVVSLSGHYQLEGTAHALQDLTSIYRQES